VPRKTLSQLSNHVPPLREKRLVRLDLEQHVYRGNALRSEGRVPNLRHERWKVVCWGSVANSEVGAPVFRSGGAESQKHGLE